jgi:N-acyl-L-homoserine lactone synthetase
MKVDILRSQMLRAAMLVDPEARASRAELLSTGEISVVVVEPADREDRAGLLLQAFALRHRCFVDYRGWEELRQADGLDRDHHDSGAALHVLDLHGERVRGHMRLIPGGYLHAAKIDPDRFEAAPEIFGLSRLCYDRDLRGADCWMGIARLFGGAIGVARRAGIRQLIFDTDPILVLYLQALGLRPQVIGETVSHRGRPMQPIALTVEPEMRAAG